MHDGGCACGGIRFRCQGDPFFASYCHCADCRKATGAPVSVFVGYGLERVRFNRPPAQRRTSAHVTRGHCPDCGSPLPYADDRLPGELYILAGAFNDPGFIVPRHHAWLDDAVPWFRVADDLPRHRGFARARPARGE